MHSSEHQSPLDLTIVVVSYNSGPLIVDYLAGVLRCGDWQSVVVDNGSNAETVALLRRELADDQLLLLSTNQGYGRAANAAFQTIKTRYALLLNPDISVSPEQIHHFFRDALSSVKGAAIWAPATSEIQHTGSGPMAVTNVLGAVMLFDMAQMVDIGLFDDNLFLFYEEQDLCRRVVGAGRGIYLLTDHYFQHAKGTSSGGSDAVFYLKHWHVGWSSCYYARKHHLKRGRRLQWLLLRYSLKAQLARSHRKRLKYRARVAGVWAYLRGQQAFDERGLPRGFRG